MEDDYGMARYFETDEGECGECGSPTDNGFGQRIKCDCDYALEQYGY